jgi:serine/threonine protein kinase
MAREVFMLKNIEHPNIIKCYLSFMEDDYLYIVMDFAEGGDLLGKIDKQKTSKRFFAEKDLWEMAWQMCCGLLHMHANDLIHRDFKAMNVLCKDKLLKIADLSESKTLNTTNYLKSKIVGTPLFLSPEIIKNENYDHRVDIWSFGCVMYHLAALEPPFSSSNMETLLKNIQFKTPKSLQG